MQIRPSRISIARADRLVGVPCLRPAEHGLHEGQQRLAVLPRRRVPQVGRAVVDGVVVHPVRDGEHRVVERRRHGPREPHALVAGHVHDEAAPPEVRQVLGLEVGQRRRGVLQRAVDDDVRLGQVRGQGHPAALGDDVGDGRLPGVVVELPDPHRVDGGAHRGDPAGGQHHDLVDAVRVQGGDRAPGRGAEPDDDRAQPAAVVAGDPDELHGLEHRAVAGELVVLVEDVEADVPVRASSGSSPRRRSGSARGRSRAASSRGPARSAASPRGPDRRAWPRRPRAGAWAARRRRSPAGSPRGTRSRPRARPARRR